MNLQIWNGTGNAMAVARSLVCAARDRYLASHAPALRRVVAKLSEAPAGSGRAQHACRLELRTADGETLRVLAEDARARGAVDRAFRRAAEALRGRDPGPAIA